MKYDFQTEWNWCKGVHWCNICGFGIRVEEPLDVRVWGDRWLVADCTSCQTKGSVPVHMRTMPEKKRFMKDVRKHGASRYFHLGHYLVAAGAIGWVLIILWGVLGESGYM